MAESTPNPESDSTLPYATPQTSGPTPLLDDKYSVGTLRYTMLGIVALFGWMIMAQLCFGLFEGNGGAGSIPFYLQDNFHISNTMISVLFNFIPMIIGTFMTPIVSFWSDRTRTRLGRRIPYILYTAPFLVLFAIGLGFSDDIIAVCKTRFAGSAHIAPMGAALIIIGFLTIGWSFFNEFVGTVFYYLLPDVMPRALLGRFQAVSSMAGTGLAMAMNTFVNEHQLTHIKAIHVGVAILYFVGFGLVCWRVKEGQYPPVEDVTQETTFVDKVKLYFKECFNHPMYIMFYLVTAVAVLSRGLNAPGIFGLHISQHQARIAAPGGGASVVSLTPDGKLFAAGGRDGTIELFDNANPKKPKLLRTFHGHGGALNALLLSADGNRIIAGSADGSIAMWDSARNGAPSRSLTGHSGAIRALALSGDGKLLASASADHFVKIWDLASGECLRTLTGHTDSVNSVAFSSTGDRLVSGGSDKQIIIWDAKSGDIVKTLEGSPGPVYAVCFAPELVPSLAHVQGSRASAALHSTLHFLKNVFVNETLYDPPPERVSRISGQDRWVVSGGRDGTTDEANSGVRIWDGDTGHLIPAVEDLKTKAMKGHKKAVTSVAYKPDLRVIVSGSLDGSMRIWKPLTLTETLTKAADDQSFRSYSGYTHGVTSMAVQAAGVRAVNASEDGTLHTWDLDQGISLQKGSVYKGNFFAIISLLLAFPMGMLVDRWNPIKIVLWTTFLGLPVTLIYYFYYHDYMSIFWIDLVMMPIGMLGGMAGLPMMVMIYPKTKYGQFCSANAMVKQGVGAFAGIIGAMIMDWMTQNSFDTDNFRYSYLFRFGTSLVSFLCLLGVYLYWKNMEGEKGYIAPEADGRHLTREPEPEAVA